MFTLPSQAPKSGDDNELRRIANGVRELAKGNFTFQASANFHPQTITTADSPYTVSSIPILVVDASGGTVTANLPPVASANGMFLPVKKADNTVNALTLDADGTETIDGAATKVLNTAWAKTILYCDGTQWLTLA